MNTIGLSVSPDKDMNEARRMLGFLPYLIAQRA